MTSFIKFLLGIRMIGLTKSDPFSLSSPIFLKIFASLRAELEVSPIYLSNALVLYSVSAFSIPYQFQRHMKLLAAFTEFVLRVETSGIHELVDKKNHLLVGDIRDLEVKFLHVLFEFFRLILWVLLNDSMRWLIKFFLERPQIVRRNLNGSFSHLLESPSPNAYRSGRTLHCNFQIHLQHRGQGLLPRSGRRSLLTFILLFGYLSEIKKSFNSFTTSCQFFCLSLHPILEMAIVDIPYKCA